MNVIIFPVSVFITEECILDAQEVGSCRYLISYGKSRNLQQVV